MQFDTHGNGNGYNDLYILPETQEEKEKLNAFISMGAWCYSNVEGQAWYGKTFLDIPFGEYLREEIERAIQ